MESDETSGMDEPGGGLVHVGSLVPKDQVRQIDRERRRLGAISRAAYLRLALAQKLAR